MSVRITSPGAHCDIPLALTFIHRKRPPTLQHSSLPQSTRTNPFSPFSLSNNTSLFSTNNLSLLDDHSLKDWFHPSLRMRLSSRHPRMLMVSWNYAQFLSRIRTMVRPQPLGMVMVLRQGRGRVCQKGDLASVVLTREKI